jgi:NRPS condensation-like uncharacterized protein
MQGRLNSIQKSMLQWNEVHPYSAVHVVQIRGTFDESRLQSCINTTLAKRGLAWLRLDCEHFAFQYESGAANSPLRTIAGDECPRGALVAEIERQLNLRFEHTQRFSPFRFLAATANDSFFLGVVYFHPVADAESIVWLLRDIVSCYLKTDAPGPMDGFELYPDSGAHLLRSHSKVVARKFLSLPRQVRNLRQSHRPPCRDANTMANGFEYFSLGAEELGSLVTVAKSWRVTANDLLMALLMKSLSPLSAARSRARKRRKISLGCIVNLRKELGIDSRQAFGVFLGSFFVTHEVQDGISLRTLATEIANQTAAIKRHKLYLAAPLELGFARFMFKFFSPERQKKLYAKHYPLWAGITNMNLNSVWNGTEPNAPLDYFRGVSTGPVTPLVLSVTTAGERVNMGVSYRVAAFTRKEIQELESRFRENLEETRRVA